MVMIESFWAHRFRLAGKETPRSLIDSGGNRRVGYIVHLYRRSAGRVLIALSVSVRETRRIAATRHLRH